jgi:hypothetical protein
MNSNNAIEGVFLRFAERMVRVENRSAQILEETRGKMRAEIRGIFSPAAMSWWWGDCATLG